MPLFFAATAAAIIANVPCSEHGGPGLLFVSRLVGGSTLGPGTLRDGSQAQIRGRSCIHGFDQMWWCRMVQLSRHHLVRCWDAFVYHALFLRRDVTVVAVVPSLTLPL